MVVITIRKEPTRYPLDFILHLIGYEIFQIKYFHFCRDCDVKEFPECMALSMCVMQARLHTLPLGRFFHKISPPRHIRRFFLRRKLRKFRRPA